MPELPKNQTNNLLIEDVKRYESTIKRIPNGEQQQLLLCVDFSFEEVSRLLEENKDCDRLRVYYARSADNRVYSFIAPVLRDSDVAKSSSDTMYYTSSAHCPPRCSSDFGLQSAETK